MAGDASPELQADDAKLEPTENPPLRCIQCGAVITHPDHAIQQSGAHRHTFSNPHGYVFAVRCFASADGCMLVGEATRAHTWFPGLAWKLGGCRTCGIHLGWGFLTDDGQVVVYGLIADRLT